MRENIRGFLFDLDGTLIDTAPDLASTANTLYHRYHEPHQPYTLLRPLAGDGIMAYLELGFGKRLAEMDIEKLKAEFLDIYLTRFGDKTLLFPGTEKLLDYLDAQQFPWGIVTNKPSFLMPLTVEKFPLLAGAKSIVCGDTVATSKPHPEPVLFACKQIQCPPEHCIFIGDHERDILAGQAAGTYTGVAQYGYIPYDVDPVDWKASALFHDVEQIYLWIAR